MKKNRSTTESQRKKSSRGSGSGAYTSVNVQNQKLLLSIETPIDFSNTIAGSSGIKHPVAGSFSKFKVRDAGVYLVSWTINFAWSDTVKNEISMDLFNITKNKSLFTTQETFCPSPTSTRTKNEIISGQTLVSLKENNIIELRAFSANNTGNIINGYFNMVKIND
jgi:hypothetical protein